MGQTETKEKKAVKKAKRETPSQGEAAERSLDLDALMDRTARAQELYAGFSQEQVDEVFRQAALAANEARIRLAKEAVAETGMGVVEDKVIKNHFAAEYIFNQYREETTCGVLEEDAASGIRKMAEPVGIICAIIPTTNPTSTAIFKALIALKTRNAVVFSPHPRAKGCTVEAVRIIRDAAEAAGAPRDILAWIPEPTLELSQGLMTHPKTALILATGGPGMVKAAYSSGRPAIGVGAGNTPAVIDETADIPMAVSSILMSKTFDNGVICASEQSVVAVEAVADQVQAEMVRRGAYWVDDPAEAEKLRGVILEKGRINAAMVGQSAERIAEMAGFSVPAGTKVLAAPAEVIGSEEPLAYEKLSPVLGFYRAADYGQAVEKARDLVAFGGFGHTAVLYTAEGNRERIARYGDRLKAGRILVNMPSSQGAIGDLYNFRLAPSLTLGCGSWGGNSVSENVGVKHLLNIKTVAERRENMLWFRLPPKVYHKYGALPTALGELKGKKRAFLVTDRPLADMGMTERITGELAPLGVETEIFSDVEPDPTMAMVGRGLERMRAFQPDVIIALGGGSPMDAAKVMKALYENPEVTFEGLALRFMDIRKRIYALPEENRKADLVAIPTTSGTGSEVTPFAVVTDEKTGHKYPLADYSLTPDMAVVDASLVMSMPRSLTAASGIDAVSHSLEAIVSVLSTEYTNAMALESLRLLFKYLPQAYGEGAENRKAREKVHNGAAMAGMAFANAFLGICHSLAHKLGAAFHLPHGTANAMMLPYVIRYNATDVPTKQTAFPQYTHPEAKARYARAADYLGLGGTTPDDKVDRLIARVMELKKVLEIPESLAAWGIDEASFRNRVDQLAEEAFDDQCTAANPRYPLITELKELYWQAYRGDSLL